MQATLLVLFGLIAASLCVPALPTLYQIQTYEFSKPYSCGGNYTTSGLFLSADSLSRNTPELLYNGACGTSFYFDCATAGNDLCFIASLGSVPLTELTPNDVVNYSSGYTVNSNFYSGVKTNTTYSVVGSKEEFRYFMAFTVDSIVDNGPAQISYSVFLYEEHSITKQSPGFDWSAHPSN